MYWRWDTGLTAGDRGREVEMKTRELDKTLLSSQVPPNVINQKELELIKRGSTLPSKPVDNPNQYDAKLDMALMETAADALLLQPMRPNRMEEYGNASWKTAGKVLTDMLYWKYPRETPKPPSIDWTE